MMNRQGLPTLTDLDDLLISDHETAGRPVLPEGSRERVIRELERIVVDRERLAAHVRAIRQRLGGTLPHREVLPEEAEEAVLRSGLGALDDGALAGLAINPGALYALRHGLFSLDDVPEVWGEVIEGDDASELPRPTPLEEILRRSGISV
jgi:hypothetical protein